MSTLPLRLLIFITALACIIQLALLPMLPYFSFLPLLNGAFTGFIPLDFTDIAFPLLLLAVIPIIFHNRRAYQQASLVQQGALNSQKAKVHAEVATRYIMELFALFKQENEKFSTEEVKKVLKTISDSHRNYHEGQISTTVLRSHPHHPLNTSAVGQHLQNLSQLLTHLIKVIRSKQAVLLPADYAFMISTLNSFITAIFSKLEALKQFNNTCLLCNTNSYEFDSGQNRIQTLNKALESINIKVYKV